MKKSVILLLIFILCFQTLFTAASFADGSAQVDGEVDPPEEEIWATSPAYRKVLFQDLLKDSKLDLSEDMSGVKVTEKAAYSGIMLEGPQEQLEAGRIGIGGTYDFDEKAVGRISISGLSDKTFKCSVRIYLDGGEEPAAVIPLRKQMGKASWKRDGEYTADVLSENITGEHTVSISFDISGLDDGETASILLRSIEFAENSLPVMYFNIDESEGTIEAMNSSEEHDAECYGSVTLQVPDGYTNEHAETGLKTMEDIELDYIRGRGNSTWWTDKKPYKIKLADKTDLLGMGKNRHWVLLANRYDNSLIRNRMTYWMIGEHGLRIPYSPKCAPVEVVMNGEYYGSYLLSQQIRVGKTRVEIDELNEKVSDPDSPEITGGYLLNLGGGEEDDDSFSTLRGGTFAVESPDFEDYPDTKEAEDTKAAQLKYIGDYVQSVEDAIYGKDFKNDKGESYKELLDMQSSIDFWWIQEFSANGDAYGGGSNYLYKKRDKTDDEGNVTERGLLYWGPLWDFDYVAWGDLEYDEETREGFNNTSHRWVNKLMTNPEYLEKTKERWPDLKAVVQEVIREGGLLDRYYEETRVSEQYEVGKWGFFADGGEYGSYYEDKEDEPAESETAETRTYKSEIEQLRGWIQRRLSWVDENIDGLEGTVYTVKFKVGNNVVSTKKVVDGEMIGTFPRSPVRKGYIFLGWYLYGEEVTEDYEVYDNYVLKAKFIKSSKRKKPADIFFQQYECSEWFDPGDAVAFYPDYTVKPAGADRSLIKWSSSNKKIATVDKKGVVSPLMTGTVKITAKLPNGKKNSFRIHFVGYDDEMEELSRMKLNKKSLKLKAGKYAGLRLTTGPQPHSTPSFFWMSGNRDVAVVDQNGVVTAKWPGKTVILVLETDTHMVRTCNVTVTATRAWRIKKAKTAKTALTVKALGGRKVKLSWKKVPGAGKYEIRAKAGKNGKYKKAALIRKGGKTSWTHKKLKKGKKMYYGIRPLSKIGKKTYRGKWSKAASVKVK